MTPGEAIALVIVLLLALYGAAQAALGLAFRLLRPEKQRLYLLLPFKGHAQDAEQQIRFAHTLVGRLVIHKKAPTLAVLDLGMDGETRRIAELLMSETGGEILDADRLKKALTDACAEGASGV